MKLKYFTKIELILWTMSLLLIIISFGIWDKSNYLNLIASLIGVTSLTFIAKGNPIGQILVLLFSLLYGYISYKQSYYGEMITYLGMTLPMAVFSFISWIKHPAKKGKNEVEINNLKFSDYILLFILSIFVTTIFYFLLKNMNTNNLIPSTISVLTSFIAVYLTFKRSKYYALAYALNDIILIVLWILASIKDITCMSVTVCFIVFFLNDIYGYINWSRMKINQERIKGDIKDV